MAANGAKECRRDVSMVLWNICSSSLVWVPDKSNFTLGELASTGILETLSEFLDENSLSTDLGEKKSKRVRFSCDNKNPCKIAHTT